MSAAKHASILEGLQAQHEHIPSHGLHCTQCRADPPIDLPAWPDAWAGLLPVLGSVILGRR